MSETDKMPVKPANTSPTTYVASGNCALDALNPALPNAISLNSCRGRAEAFARSLSSKLRTLGIQSEECMLGNMATSCEALQSELILDGGREDFSWLSQHKHLNTKYMSEEQSLRKNSPEQSTEHLFKFEDHQTESPASPESEKLSDFLNGEELINTHLYHGKISSASCSLIPSATSSSKSATSMKEDTTERYRDLHKNYFQVKDIQESEMISDYLNGALNMIEKLSIEETKSVEKPEIQIQNETNEKFINGDQSAKCSLPIARNLFDTDYDGADECRTPNVRRCSSLKTGKTPPGTPGRKKIVRFADVLGLDLADVKTFLDEIPTVPKSAYEDLHGLDNDTTSIVNQREPNKMLIALFQQPETLPTFLDIVREKRLCLERACVTDATNQTITGWVRVRNLDFHKSLYVRYSFDGWRTFADLQASYVENSCDGFSDQFSFTLYGHSLSVGQRLEFAVRFHCQGQQYWDNNDGGNYCFQCIQNGPGPNKLSNSVSEKCPEKSSGALSLSPAPVKMVSTSGIFKLRMMRAAHRPTMAAISAINIRDFNKPFLQQADNFVASNELRCSAFY